MMRSLIILSAATSLAATPAVAQSEPVSVTVSYADLNLTTEAGRARLDRRIRIAAAAVCSPREMGVHLRAAYDNCCKDAATDASARMASLRKGDMRVQVAARTLR
jgi:UrcA family protein